MTAHDLFNMFAETLQPIIIKDKDILGCIERNNFSGEERQTFVLWLLNATICVVLDGDEREVSRELVANCQHDMRVCENMLEKAGYEEVEGTLKEILSENIGEWMDILRAIVAKHVGEQEEPKKPAAKKAIKKTAKKSSGKKAQDSQAEGLFKIHTFFFKEVMMREEDTIELLDKWTQVDRDVLTVYLVLNVFFTYLHEIKRGHINPPADYPLVKQLDEVLEITENGLNELASSHIAPALGNMDAFNADVAELINDHLQEFAKKTFKQLFKAADEVNKRG